MARTAPRKRLNLSPPEGEEEGWTPVTSKRRRKKTTTIDTAPDYRTYKVVRHESTSTFHAIRRLEKEHPNLSVRVRETSSGVIHVKPLDEESAFSLARMSRETTAGISLAEVEGRSRGILSGYPLHQSLQPLQEDPRVAFARRCTYNAGHCRRVPTRQVEVTLRGPLPESLDLGFWGVFPVRKLAPEPLRCFNCHAFGHVQKYCRTRPLCGVCSGRHSSSQCIDALRTGATRAARCPNCGGRHHAWSKGCPERLRRLPPQPRRALPDQAVPRATPRASPPASMPTMVVAGTQTTATSKSIAATQTPRTKKARATQTTTTCVAPDKRDVAAQARPAVQETGTTTTGKLFSYAEVCWALQALEAASVTYEGLAGQGRRPREEPLARVTRALREGAFLRHPSASLYDEERRPKKREDPRLQRREKTPEEQLQEIFGH